MGAPKEIRNCSSNLTKVPQAQQETEYLLRMFKEKVKKAPDRPFHAKPAQTPTADHLEV